MNNILNQFNEKVSNLVKNYVENLIFSKGISSFTDDLVAEFAHLGSDLTQFIIEYAGDLAAYGVKISRQEVKNEIEELNLEQILFINVKKKK